MQINFFISVIMFALFASLIACQDRNKNDLNYSNHSKDHALYRWNFLETGVSYRYRYIQEMTTPGNSNNKNINLNAELIIKSKGDSTAELILEGISVYSDPEHSHSMPPRISSGIKENGTSLGMNNSEDAMLQLLFSLPQSVISVGESIKQEVQFPMSVNGVKGYVPIDAIITLYEDEKSNDSKVAKFKVTFASRKPVSYTKQNFPDAYSIKISGYGESIFDPRKNVYLESNIDLTTEIGGRYSTNTSSTNIHISLLE